MYTTELKIFQSIKRIANDDAIVTEKIYPVAKGYWKKLFHATCFMQAFKVHNALVGAEGSEVLRLFFFFFFFFAIESLKENFAIFFQVSIHQSFSPSLSRVHTTVQSQLNYNRIIIGNFIYGRIFKALTNKKNVTVIDPPLISLNISAILNRCIINIRKATSIILHLIMIVNVM